MQNVFMLFLTSRLPFSKWVECWRAQVDLNEHHLGEKQADMDWLHVEIWDVYCHGSPHVAMNGLLAGKRACATTGALKRRSSPSCHPATTIGLEYMDSTY